MKITPVLLFTLKHISLGYLTLYKFVVVFNYSSFVALQESFGLLLQIALVTLPAEFVSIVLKRVSKCLSLVTQRCYIAFLFNAHFLVCTLL